MGPSRIDEVVKGNGMRFRDVFCQGVLIVWGAHAAVACAQVTGANPPPASAADVDASATSSAIDEDGRFAAHGQATFVEQITAPFHAPYSGPNSLSPRQGAETFDLTLFLGARLWPG